MRVFIAWSRNGSLDKLSIGAELADGGEDDGPRMDYRTTTVEKVLESIGMGCEEAERTTEEAVSSDVLKAQE